jgi:hypothetical protein
VFDVHVFTRQSAKLPNNDIEKLSTQHCQAVLRVLRYLKGTRDVEITCHRDCSPPNILHGYTDASWAFCSKLADQLQAMPSCSTMVE